MTDQRRIIARVLSESTDHPDVEEVYGRASDIDSHISIATVYRTLRLFDIANIIDRHDFGDGRSRYEVADEVGHHHHLIDMKNGHVLEFENAELEKYAAIEPESTVNVGVAVSVLVALDAPSKYIPLDGVIVEI